MSASAAPALALAAALALGAAACSSDYSISLQVSDATNAACNTSCVGSVSVEIFGNNGAFQCFDNHTMASLRDHGLDGAIDFPVPDGLLGANIIGYRGKTCDDLEVFDAVGKVEGRSLALPVECSASCSQVGTLNVRTTDIIAAMQGRCDNGTGVAVTGGVMRASHLSSVIPNYGGEATLFSGGKSVALSAGAASIPDAVLSAGALRSCAAVMVTSASALPATLACVRAGLRGLCSPPNTVEVATFRGGVLASVVDGYRTVAVFAERDAGTGLPRPIADATVTVDRTGPPATVEYLNLDPVTGMLTPRAEQYTGVNGAFAIISKEPVFITVTSRGVQYRRMVGGATVYAGMNIFDITGAQIFTPE